MTITQYQVQYKTDETTSWSNCPPVSGSPPATSTVVNGMNTGSKYTVRVRARSAVGAGQWSSVQTIGKELYACTDILYIHACHYTAQLHVVFIGLFLAMQLSTPLLSALLFLLTFSLYV